MKHLIALVVFACLTAGCANSNPDPIRISWESNVLTLSSPRIPGRDVRILYLEAFCRPDSTDRDWKLTTIPHTTRLVSAEPDRIRLVSDIDGKADVTHDIRSTADEIQFEMTLHNHSTEYLDAEWVQPCIQVGEFTGRSQADYFKECFIFTKSGLTRLDETHRSAKARYTPGQVYVPANIDLNDVNPRPISQTRPVNGLIGCFSADEKMILATAWDSTQELFQGVIRCIHNDMHIGGLKPGETKKLKGRIYIIPNDVDELLRRYGNDFKGRS